MALITDPDSLNQGTEVVIDESAKTIQLVATGNLSTDGVTVQCLYSFLKEEWKDDATLIPFSFPMEAITPEQFEFLDGWAPKDTTSRNLMRTAGWAERNTSGDIIKMFACVVSLGTLTGQPYYDNSGAVTNFTYTGAINEAVQILDDPNGDGSYVDGYDRRTTLTLYSREQAKQYASSDLAAIGVTTMTYQAYRFPLSNAGDTKVTESDVTVDAYDIDITVLDQVDRGAWADSTVYAANDFVLSAGRYYQTPAGGTSSGTGVADDVGVTDWEAYDGERQIGSSYYAFGVIIDGDATANGSNHTANEIYMHVQSALRKATDIDADADSQTGQLCPELLEYVGDTLKTKYVTNPQGGAGGVFVDNFDSNDTNSITFQDSGDVERQYPFVSAGTINFSSTIQSDTTSKYWMFFSTNPAGDFGTSNAVIVDDNGGTDIAGTNPGASVSFDFDYDGNVQGGRTAGTDADVTLVAIGTDGAQYVAATGTITRATGLAFTLTAALERNYVNP